MIGKISSLKYVFESSPKNTPAVKITFSGSNFTYANEEYSAKIVAEYSEIDMKNGNYYSIFSSYNEEGEWSSKNEDIAKYNDCFGSCLTGFYAPGYEKIYIKCIKSSVLTTQLRFEFYAYNPLDNSDYFATSIVNYSTTNTKQNVYKGLINDNNRNCIGNFTFTSAAVSGDVIFDLPNDKSFMFCLKNEKNDWHSATLLYEDKIESSSSDEEVDEYINHYPINDKGQIVNAINYWDIKSDFTLSQIGTYCLRIRLEDTNNNYTDYYSTIIEQNNGKYSINELAYFVPVFRYDLTEEYNPDYCTDEKPLFKLSVPNEVDNYDNLTSSLMDKCSFYRFSESVFNIQNSKWTNFSNENGKTVFNFYMQFASAGGYEVGQVVDELKTVVVQISDGNGNTSEIVEYDYTFANPVYTVKYDNQDIDFYISTYTENKTDKDFYNNNPVYSNKSKTLYLFRGVSFWYISELIGDENNALAKSETITGEWTTLKSEIGEVTLLVSSTDYYWKKDSKRYVYLYRQAPNSIVFNLKGTTGNKYYTGFYQNEKGYFIPSNKITVDVYANENLGLPLEYKLFIGDAKKEVEWRKFNYPQDETTYHDIPFYLTSESDEGLYGNNYSVEVNLVFRSAAGLETEIITRNIYYNTVLLQTEKTNLRDKSNTYTPIIRYYNGDEKIEIQERENFDLEETIRSWDEVFYPITHSFPLNSTGTIDIENAILVKSGDANFDPVKYEEYEEEVIINDKKETVKKKRLKYDEEKRPLTDWSDFGNTKMYNSLISNSKTYNSDTGEMEGMEYWIIDSSGYTDFYLEFEHFHLDNTPTEPINNLSPFPGDCLVVYDASADGATQEYINRYGKKAYKLVDSSKLTMLAAYTGDGVDAFQLFPEEKSLNATGDGAFTTEKFVTTSRVCLIFYSDSGSSKSGFKLKASPNRETNWLNWEIDNKRGELWIHKIDKEQMENNTDLLVPSKKSGYCPDEVDMSYEYSGTAFDIDYKDGSIRFYEKPEGQVWGTFCYYDYSQTNGAYVYDKTVGKNVPVTLTYALTNDDLLDYRDVSIYVSSDDGKIDKEIQYSFSEEHSYGKIISNIVTYKDSGLIEFNNALPPKNIMYSDYYCHSYYRLTDDGYGDLKFYDSVLVPEKSDIYPYYTYVDLKLTNEGSAALSSGRLKFTLRGIATNDTITSVLNPDRPWDVQQGTADETIDLVGGIVRSNYDFPPINFENMLAIATGGTIKDDTNNSYTSQQTELDFANAVGSEGLKPKQNIYIRVVWNLCTSGSSDAPQFVTISAGEKVFSSEIEGTFYSIEV